MNNYDVAVIGAGPSGSWTAYRLARRGVRVLLADPSHPREKPCGGGITGRSLAIVAEVLDPRSLPAVRIDTARFIATAPDETARIMLGAGGLIVASRAAFDGLLLAAARRAGAQLVRARLVNLARSGGTFQLTMSDGSRHVVDFIVGADGANSLTRRRLIGAFRRDQLSMATGFFAHGVTANEIVIEFVSNPPGYLWCFPRPNHLAIGICAPADKGAPVTALRARTGAWMSATGLGAGARLERYSWPIPSLSARDCASLVVAGPGWLLVGDAAGLVDPVTREGIFYALQSGQYAADALASGARHPDKAFSERVRDEIVPELTRAARYQARFFRPRFTRLFVEALRHSEKIRRVAADLVAGTQSYGDLQWRLAGTMEIGLAVRLLAGVLR